MKILRIIVIKLTLSVILVTAAFAQSVPPLKPQEFSSLIQELSERGGHFSQDNWVSNELSYLEVLEPLQKHDIKGGVYIGVGPDQNFSYITKIKPDLAFFVDVRQLNRLQHLVYKVIFELTETRVEYFSLLFSTPVEKDAAIGAKSNIEELVDYFRSNYRNRDYDMRDETSSKVLDVLTNKYKFSFTETEIGDLDFVLKSFFRFGMDITYTGNRRSWYPTYGELMLIDFDGKMLNPFNSREDFLYLKKMHSENRIIPLTGNFGGEKAISGLGGYLKRRNLTVSAYYVSNVEQYVIRSPFLWDQWVENIRSLPLTEKSVFIRWTHENGYYDHQTRLQFMQDFIRRNDDGEYMYYNDLKYTEYLRDR